MVTNQKLFSVGTFDFRLQHMLVIGILIISFSISMMIRSQPVSYGFELNEFDPFFNYRATQYLLENGLNSYNLWIDEKSWYPYGRDVSNTSQTMLHLSGAVLYKIFGFNQPLYEFTILFPVIFISLSSIVLFGLVRKLGGTTAGLIASLLFSISYPIAIRGFIGWYKSEPLGIFFGLLALYFLISGIYPNRGKISAIKVVLAGSLLAFGFSSWGGIQFFILPLTTFFFILPFVRNDVKFILWIIPTFVASILLPLLFLERPGISFIFGYGGFLLIGSTLFLTICCLLKSKFSKKSIPLIIFIIIISTGIILLVSDQVGLPTFRYLNAINPMLVSEDPLTDSVSEHFSASTQSSFAFFSIHLIFSGIGIWLIFQNYSKSTRKDLSAFMLILSIIGVYASSVFMRLEVFSSISIIILSSVGISILLQKFSYNQKFLKRKLPINKIILVPAIIVLLAIPITLPISSANWISGVNHPPTIMSGGNTFGVYNNDWKDAMNWLKNNTPEDAVVASWWDYGYWITALSERKTLIDNATLIHYQIEKVAFSFLSNTNNAWHILNSDYKTDVSNYLGETYLENFDRISDHQFLEDYKKNHDGQICKQIFKAEAQQLGVEEESCNVGVKGLDADYVLIYMTAMPVETNYPVQLYVLNGGGDFQKKGWFMEIAKIPANTMLKSDGESATDLFWKNTLLGNLIPFSPVLYVDPQTGIPSDKYFHGAVTLYTKNVKLYGDNSPFELVYASPSFHNDDGIRKISSVLIYEINKNFS